MKKVFSLLLVAMMLLSLGTVAFAAANNDPGSNNTTTLKVLNATEGVSYNYYKIFDATFQNVQVDDTTKPIPNTDPVEYEKKTVTLVSYFTDASHKAVIDAMNTSASQYYDSGCPFLVSDVAETNGKYAVTVKDNVQDAALIAWLQAANATATSSKNYELLALAGPVNMPVAAGQASATVTAGYYYITSSLGTVVTVDSALSGVNVYDKNEADNTIPEKKITGEGETAGTITTFTGKDTNDSAVGKVEQFTVTYDAVNYVNKTVSGTFTTEKVTSFTITDTPTGLDIDTSSVKVYVEQPAATFETDGATEWIELTAAGYTPAPTISKNSTTGVLTVSIPWTDTATGAHIYEAFNTTMQIPVKLVYNATVTADAATEAAPNVVEVKYGRDGSNDLTSIGTDGTTTYTYGFELIKVDGDSNALLGAEFKLFPQGSNTAIQFVLESGAYRVATPAEIADNSVTTTDTISLTTTGVNSNTAEIRGLDLGTYTLSEVTVPQGFNRAADITVVVTTSDSTDTSVQKKLTKIETSLTDLADLTVENKSGTELPETGGVGTKIIYTLGAILFLGAGIVLVARRKVADQ